MAASFEQEAVWTAAHRALWARIVAHDFEPANQSNFTQRLARERSWSIRSARAAILEYRRFCFLAVAGYGPMTPSEEVDEVWHLHLSYSRDYWEQWCGLVLQTPLHHEPSRGGQIEVDRYREQYAATLALYETFFEPACVEFWPAAHERFGRPPRFKIVDRDRWMIIPHPRRLMSWLDQTKRE